MSSRFGTVLASARLERLKAAGENLPEKSDPEIGDWDALDAFSAILFTRPPTPVERLRFQLGFTQTLENARGRPYVVAGCVRCPGCLRDLEGETERCGYCLEPLK